jgi:PST family polysaccharide transporter
LLEALLLLLYPGLIFMLANSRTIILLTLGSRWAGVVPIFQLLGADAFVAPLAYSMGWLFLSQGRTREMRDWSVPTSILFTIAFAIGLRWGPQGIAAGYAAAAVGEMSFLWRIGTRSGPLRGRDFWSLLLPFVFATAITFATTFGAASWMPSRAIFLPASLLIAYATFVAALGALPRGRALLRDLAHQASERLQSLRRARAAAAAPVPEGS